MDITSVYKREHDYVYYAQKLSRGSWKTFAFGYDLDSIWSTARVRFAVENEKVRVIRVECSTLIQYC